MHLYYGQLLVSQIFLKQKSKQYDEIIINGYTTIYTYIHIAHLDHESQIDEFIYGDLVHTQCINFVLQTHYLTSYKYMENWFVIVVSGRAWLLVNI